MENRSVRVVADNMLPYITSCNDSDVRLGGFLGDIWHTVKDRLHFNHSVQSVDYDTGIKLMTQRKADVMLAAVVYKKGLKHVEYSQPYFYNWYHLYMKKPEATASSSYYLKTLDTNLWTASITLLLTFGFILCLTNKLTNRLGYGNRDLAISTCLFTVFSGLLNQGYDPGVKSTSARIQVLTCLLFGFLLYSAMNAVLVAQLASYEFALPFKSLEEVSIKRTHSICVRTNSFVYNDFIDSNRSLSPEWKGLVNGPGCLDLNDQKNVAPVLCRDNVVVLESRTVISTVRRRFPISCEIAYLKDKLFVKPNSFLMLKTFPLKNIIQMEIQKLADFGMLKRIQQHWVSDPENEKSIDQITFSQVTIHHVCSILILLLTTIGVSLIILTVEIIYSKYCN
ncbi:PREDICTED: uncharacterized protein LOC108569960 [Nicrophorus vespilloides]|uniref:Uncharacterized protein LOC108569960 n=1 Tax=Nicrophorus vespilloides TaxID=110193 RepID=A0ABM1NK86_NICVS|nr:PREDICTED: uncharacterized protein LOC108569960 [Nicrophorus vespilloides]